MSIRPEKLENIDEINLVKIYLDDYFIIETVCFKKKYYEIFSLTFL